jgi:hypothetical protein
MMWCFYLFHTTSNCSQGEHDEEAMITALFADEIRGSHDRFGYSSPWTSAPGLLAVYHTEYEPSPRPSQPKAPGITKMNIRIYLKHDRAAAMPRIQRVRESPARRHCGSPYTKLVSPVQDAGWVSEWRNGWDNRFHLWGSISRSRSGPFPQHPETRVTCPKQVALYLESVLFTL